jgi:hypothetical protein
MEWLFPIIRSIANFYLNFSKSHLFNILFNAGIVVMAIVDGVEKPLVCACFLFGWAAMFCQVARACISWLRPIGRARVEILVAEDDEPEPWQWAWPLEDH